MPWIETRGGIGVLDVAPLSRNEIFLNTAGPRYPDVRWPMATLQPNGVPTSGFADNGGSWVIIDFTSAAVDAMPRDVVMVDVQGIMAITMSQVIENVDLRVWLAAPSMINVVNSYCGQVECVNLAQGQRSPFARSPKCEQGAFAFAWWFGNGVTQEQIDPQHATGGFSLHVPRYYR